ncbi:transposable element Tc1 transposase [Trichonephila clavipes]|nr:transposable element Tc1 transposase [Trichonephila clavipes]
MRGDPALTIARYTCPQKGVMFWGAICFDTHTPLVVISDTLTEQRYNDDILKSVVLPFFLRHPGITFQHGNTRPQTASVLPYTSLPARSFTISPIEYI